MVTRVVIQTHTMATQYGCQKELQPDSDSVKAYLELVTLYFEANETAIAKCVTISLSSIGASTYTLLNDLLAPISPGKKSFEEISTALCNHFEPKQLVRAELFDFHKCEQIVGETIADFDAALRKLAIYCQFGDTLEEILRDRFVCWLYHDSIQRQLLSETTLTYMYHKALELQKGWKHLTERQRPS